MKISAVVNDINNINKQNCQKKNQSFTGITDGMVNFWQFVDNHGRAMQFTVEDMCGTNFPRTIKGALAGYKYTGKINYAALAQEALREFLTGPIMCTMPVAILFVVKSLFGKTSDTHIENIKNLSYIMSGLEGASTENIDVEFIKSAVKDMLVKTTGKEDINPETVNELTQKIFEYRKHLANQKLSKQQLKDLNITKPKGKELKAELAEICNSIQSIVKADKSSYSDTNFLTAKYSISQTKTGATKASNYVNYIINYANDFKKSMKSGAEKVTNGMIESFKSGWVAKRFGIILAMIGITGFAMSYIPKLYTKASGNVNPNAKTIYKEAEKLPHNARKEEVKA